jgi:RNA polymerase sigma-70 factor (ECF subfamily)
MKTTGISTAHEVAVCVPSLRAVAMVLTSNRERADNLVEDVIIRVLSGSELAPPRTKVKVWMFTILHQLHYAALIKNHLGIRSIGDAVADTPGSLPSREDGLVSSDFRRAFWQLGDKEREVLILEATNDLSREEIANVCGCATSLIDMRASRACRKLLRTLSAPSGGIRRSGVAVSLEITPARAGQPREVSGSAAEVAPP